MPIFRCGPRRTRNGLTQASDSRLQCRTSSDERLLGITARGDGELPAAQAIGRPSGTDPRRREPSRSSKELADLFSRARRHFAAVELSTTIRAGFVVGFALTRLPLMLGRLRRAQPKLEIFA